MMCSDDIADAALSGRSVCLDQGEFGGSMTVRCQQELETSGWMRDSVMESALGGIPTIGEEARAQHWYPALRPFTHQHRAGDSWPPRASQANAEV